MNKNVCCTCEVVVLLIKPIVFLDVVVVVRVVGSIKSLMTRMCERESIKPLNF